MFPVFPCPFTICRPFTGTKISDFIRNDSKIKRKEVIHPQLRLGIPCYDLSFIAKLGLDLAYARASSTPDFAALTGGVYKTRERIHRSLLICDYY